MVLSDVGVVAVESELEVAEIARQRDESRWSDPQGGIRGTRRSRFSQTTVSGLELNGF